VHAGAADTIAGVKGAEFTHRQGRLAGIVAHRKGLLRRPQDEIEANAVAQFIRNKVDAEIARGVPPRTALQGHDV